jgi:hypothetical protein
MHAKQIIRESLELADMTTVMLLDGLSDQDMLVRSVPGANTVAWMFGHLVTSENQMGNLIKADGMPPLPAGMAEQYDPKNAASDAQTDWKSKNELLQLMKEQRTGTLRLLDAMSDAELAAPGPEFLQGVIKTKAGIFELIAAHWQNHTGQFSVVRRKLGKPHAF